MNGERPAERIRYGLVDEFDVCAGEAERNLITFLEAVEDIGGVIEVSPDAPSRSDMPAPQNENDLVSGMCRREG